MAGYLQKSLYGLKPGFREWFQLLLGSRLESSINPSNVNPCNFFRDLYETFESEACEVVQPLWN